MNADERRVTFRCDEVVLRDLRRLFESGLGEGPDGLDGLPDGLSYLR
jgi:hypothetical protein